jgi:hypothetical protein
MKTIRPPKLPKVEDRVYRIDCQNKECGAFLEMGHGEMSHHENQMDGQWSQFVCPHCKGQTSVYALKKFLVPDEPTPRYPIPDR